MATSSEERARKLRAAACDGGEPMLKTDRKLRKDGSSDSAFCNLSATARRVIGLAPGKTATLEVYNDHVRIYPAGED